MLINEFIHALLYIAISYSQLGEHIGDASVVTAFIGYIDNNAPLLNEAQIAQVLSTPFTFQCMFVMIMNG